MGGDGMKHNITHFNTIKMLQSAQALIAHLITWGEVSCFELVDIDGSQEWVSLFKSAGIVHPAITDENSNVWCLSPRFWSLLKEDSEKACRTILFQIPKYCEYLISILAEGVVVSYLWVDL